MLPAERQFFDLYLRNVLVNKFADQFSGRHSGQCPVAHLNRAVFKTILIQLSEKCSVECGATHRGVKGAHGRTSVV